MVSTMRAWTRPLASLCAIVALAGCDQLQHQMPGVLIVRAAGIVHAIDGIELDLDLDCQLNGPMSDALEHGIPLTLGLELASEAHNGSMRERRTIELRYFPLTRRYQLREPGSDVVRSFSAYGSLIDALASIRIPLPSTFAELPPGTRLRVRVALDHAALPGPLRLPALLEPAWRLAAPEYTWIVAAG